VVLMLSTPSPLIPLFPSFYPAFFPFSLRNPPSPQRAHPRGSFLFPNFTIPVPQPPLPSHLAFVTLPSCNSIPSLSSLSLHSIYLSSCFHAPISICNEKQCLACSYLRSYSHSFLLLLLFLFVSHVACTLKLTLAHSHLQQRKPAMDSFTTTTKIHSHPHLAPITALAHDATTAATAHTLAPR
jgi:hypothetical protein